MTETETYTATSRAGSAAGNARGGTVLQVLPRHLAFGYIGRPERASPGEGYPAAHTAEQNRILRTALDLSVPVSMYPIKTPGER